VDDSFLKQFIRNMEEQPSGNYKALLQLKVSRIRKNLILIRLMRNI